MLAEFKAFLKGEFSFTLVKYYAEKGMAYGTIYGAEKDAEAKKQGRIIKRNENFFDFFLGKPFKLTGQFNRVWFYNCVRIIIL
jgi:hypothetical protein